MPEISLSGKYFDFKVHTPATLEGYTHANTREMITNSGRRVVGKPKNASRARSQGARMQTAKLDSARQPGRASRAGVPGYRNNNINAQSQWGGIAPTGKAAAQAAILQYAGASGAMGLIFLSSNLRLKC